MTDQNWRPEVDAEDYFGNQHKRLQLADRRPVIRRASDLVGPGIGATAVNIDNFNTLLAQYNGFFSAVDGTPNAPSSGAFVGYVVSDADIGGRQTFTRVSDGAEFSRTFKRNPADPSYVTWDMWTQANYVQAGNLIMHGGATAPPGWLLCRGQAVSRTEYAALFSVIGTLYGAGNGSTTFNVPNLESRFPYGAGGLGPGWFGGASLKTIAEANLPAHSHSMNHAHTMNHSHPMDHSHTMNHTHPATSKNVRYATNTTDSGSATRVADIGGVTGANPSGSGSLSIDTPAHNGSTGGASSSSTGPYTGNTGTHTGSTGTAGSGTPLDIMPPWTAVNFIIKT